MNMKVVYASLAAGVFSFLLGWLLWDMMGLMNYYSHNMTPAYNGIMKEKVNMNMLGMIISNLAYGAMVGWAMWRMGVNTAMAGFMAAAVLGGLFAISLDMFFYSMMNMYANKMIVIVDVLVSAVTTGLAGAVAGQVLGMGKKAA